MNKLVFGVISDPQYADRDPQYGRWFRNSLDKATEALHILEENNCEFVIVPGDVIDEGFENFEPIMKVFNASPFPIYAVMGNHDYSIADEYYDRVPSILGMPAPYYSKVISSWRFIFLDSNDISIKLPSTNPKHDEAVRLIDEITARGDNHGYGWNGGFSNEQLQWLQSELINAKDHGQQVILVSHDPVFPEVKNRLLNSTDVLDIIHEHSENIIAYLAGHHHDGAYAELETVHHITFKGMVDTQDKSAFSVVSVNSSAVTVEGFGRENSRQLTLS